MKKILKLLAFLLLAAGIGTFVFAVSSGNSEESIIVRLMFDNSMEWNDAKEADDAKKMQLLHGKNEELATQLDEMGVKTEFDTLTGVWMLDENEEKPLYDEFGLSNAEDDKKVVVNGKELVTLAPPENESEDEQSEKDGEFLTVIKAMTKGFWITFKLFAITLAGALPLGLVIALCSMSKFLPLKWFTRMLVWIIRGTPLMLQLLIIFYIPGMALDGGSPWPRGEDGRYMAACVAFIINYAFYFSEIYRGGIESIPQGQVEAGQVLGMTKTQIFFNVTLLQMVKRIVPPMSNEIITLVKDTSIARIISLQEVIWAGYSFLKGSHGYSGLLWPLFFTGVYYLLFNGLLTILFSRIEKKLSYFKA